MELREEKETRSRGAFGRLNVLASISSCRVATCRTCLNARGSRSQVLIAVLHLVTPLVWPRALCLAINTNLAVVSFHLGD